MCAAFQAACPELLLDQQDIIRLPPIKKTVGRAMMDRLAVDGHSVVLFVDQAFGPRQMQVT